MPDLILHHYDLSPFCEKVRVALGHKGLDWRAVEIPIWPPRPDYTPLTAGYRRAPALQVGADIYCDTLLILRELERRAPEPTLYPDGARGLAAALSRYFDAVMFIPAAKMVTSIIGDGVPSEFIEDRIAFMKEDFRRDASLKELPVNRQRVHAEVAALADMLKDGHPFLLGDRLSAADISAYHMFWFTKQIGGAEAEAMLPLDALRPWIERVAAVGHSRKTPMTPAEALEAARAAEPVAVGSFQQDPASGLKAGDAVSIVSDAANDPIRGTLAYADADEIVIRTENARTGPVHVHFPRLGYSAVAA